MEISKLQELSLFESIMLFEKELKSKADWMYEKLKNYSIAINDEKYVLIDLKKWSSKEKELLLKSAMIGINHFYFNLTQKRSLNIGGFNSIIEVFNGKEEVHIYVNSIKWFPDDLKTKIRNQGIDYNETINYLKRKSSRQNRDEYDSRNWLSDASGTNDPETMNDVYWNLD